ncbi:hypothetical protein [Thiomicrorhabdus lithotrophica]|uniref:Uncharacterized protein n=1 Tax=Thiomicrorhabdus lithotrophica TaxID=2949997 RepID=A0ABY8CBX4_9GAMM|nr:hypothetical protein [Thiomicrorhabdus lithotrophica]WEJ62175.1 hypothetical protein NR989_09155 [Thiomicrorhabdus lithotrophica]
MALKNLEHVEVCQIVNYWEINQKVEKNVNPVYKASIKVQTKDQQPTQPYTEMAYIKFIDPWKIYAECVSAIVGRALGLPIPQPMIGLLKTGVTPPPGLPENSGIETPVFVSIDMKHPSVRNLITNHSTAIQDNKLGKQYAAKLRKWSKLLEAGSFDEFIANNDRQFGNLLYEKDNSFFLIDHELAIPKNLVQDEKNQANHLYTLYTDNEIGKKLAIKKTPAICKPYQSFTAAEVKSKTLCTEYISDIKHIDQSLIALYNRAQQLTSILLEYTAQAKDGQLSLSYHETTT